MLFEGPALDMAQWYAYTSNLFLFCMFYSHLLPILFPIGVLGTLYAYWAEKYVLLRRNKIPEVVGSTIAKFYTNMLPIAMIIYALAIFGMTFEVTTGKKTYDADSILYK